jgi:anti-sigma factor RsiW
MNSHLDPDLLSAYLDDEVTPDERALISEHLGGCEACQTELESLRWTVALLNRLPEVSPPRTFYVTEQMLEAPAPKLPWWRQWRNPFLGSLGAVAALLLCVLLIQMPQTSPNTASTAMESAAPAAESEIALEQEAPAEAAGDARQSTEAADGGASNAETGSTLSDAPADPTQDEAVEEPAEEAEAEPTEEAAEEEAASEEEAFSTLQATELPEEQTVEESAEEAPAENGFDTSAADAAPEATLEVAPEAEVPEIAESGPVEETQTEQLDDFSAELPQQPAPVPDRTPLLVVSSVLVLLVLGWIVWRRRQG